MTSKAIILFSDNSENDKISGWCTNEVASIPIYKRAILSANKAGIDKFVFFGYNAREKIESSITSDKRIRADIKWYDKSTNVLLGEVIANEAEKNPTEHLFIINANTLFDYRVLNSLSTPPSNNAVATIAIKKTINISSDIDSIKKQPSNISPENVINCGIAVVSNKIKDLLNPVGDVSSLCKLREKVSKENLLNTVEIKDYLCEEINSQASLLSAERKLYRSLGSSSDSPIIDRYVIRKISGAISSVFLKTSLTPNQITIISMILGILSGAFFSLGTYTYNIPAGLLYFLSVILDQCDGEVARLKHMESESGNILDIICDTIVNAAIVVGITIAIYKSTGSGLILMLGLSAMVGISISLLLTTYFDEKKKEGKTDKEKKFFDKLNNKDFFYVIVIVCIAINQMIWFLLIMAIGSNIYWITRKLFHRVG